ncbi:hypothetical protein [Anaerotignum sp.]
MEIKKVRLFAKEYLSYKELQKKAFPKEEQYPLWLLRLLSVRKGIDYQAYHEKDLFCGITYTSATEKMLYILYLAVNDNIRSKGYGIQILELLKKKHNEKEIVLNVEPLDELAENCEQRRKRMDFYHRNGFRDTGYRLVDVTGEYMILSTAKKLSVENYREAISRIGMNLYKPKVIAHSNGNDSKSNA